LELIVRLESELLVQQPPARAVDLERVCLAAAAIEGQHQLAAQTFPQRLLAHEPLELGNQLRVAPQRELGLDPLPERGQPLLFQPRSLAAGEGVAELRQRRSTPQGQPFPVQPGGLGGLLRAGRRYQQLEAMEVEFTIADPDEIAGGLRQDQIPAERLAQLGDVHLERRRGGGGRIRVPELVDQAVP